MKIITWHTLQNPYMKFRHFPDICPFSEFPWHFFKFPDNSLTLKKYFFPWLFPDVWQPWVCWSSINSFLIPFPTVDAIPDSYVGVITHLCHKLNTGLANLLVIAAPGSQAKWWEIDELLSAMFSASRSTNKWKNDIKIDKSYKTSHFYDLCIWPFKWLSCIYMRAHT